MALRHLGFIATSLATSHCGSFLFIFQQLNTGLCQGLDLIPNTFSPSCLFEPLSSDYTKISVHLDLA